MSEMEKNSNTAETFKVNGCIRAGCEDAGQADEFDRAKLLMKMKAE